MQQNLHRAIGLAEAARRMRGRGGRPPSTSTVRRWADPRQGYRPQGHTGQPIVLRTLRVGQDLATLPEWIEEFELSRERLGAVVILPLPVRGVPARTRNAAHRRAEQALDEAGIL